MNHLALGLLACAFLISGAQYSGVGFGHAANKCCFHCSFFARVVLFSQSFRLHFEARLRLLLRRAIFKYQYVSLICDKLECIPSRDQICEPLAHIRFSRYLFGVGFCMADFDHAVLSFNFIGDLCF